MTLTIFNFIVIVMIFLDVVAIILVINDEFLYWEEKLFKIFIIIILPFIGAYLEFIRNDDGTGSGSSTGMGGTETPPSSDGGD